MNTKEALIKGKALIEEYGWIQGALGDLQHGFCATGAARWAVLSTGTPSDVLDVVTALHGATPRRGPFGLFGRWKNAVDYNDALGRTKADILKLYDRAIANA